MQTFVAKLVNRGRRAVREGISQKRSRGIIRRWSAKLNGNLIGATMNSNSSYLKTNQIKKDNMDESFRKFERFLKRDPSLPVPATN